MVLGQGGELRQRVLPHPLRPQRLHQQLTGETILRRHEKSPNEKNSKFKKKLKHFFKNLT